METLGQDLRYAFRTLLKNRGLTTVAVLSLALGIGANTTIFTFINGLVALAASYVPARWATRVDPIQALRSE